MADLEWLNYNISALQKAMGIFTHYSLWVASFFEKIYPLTQITSFLLNFPAIKDFEGFKMDIANSAIVAINLTIPLLVETDTANCAIATLLW